MLHFKEGSGWKACYDDERNLYTAQTWSRGSYHLYEIDEQIFSRIGEPGVSEFETEKLIASGRHLYMDIDDTSGPPYTVVLDEDYATLCPWADVQSSGHQWPSVLTDIAVNIFESEADNREQRKKNRPAEKEDMKKDAF
ncbi:MAG: hypothetical protein IJ607_00440 [Bacteroidaceae bacterium]|nr:hypothetical protein [Bacteroidaceae bacterium]